MNEVNKIKSLFEKHFKLEPERINVLQDSGSPRVNARLFLYGSTYIGTYGSNIPENETFLYLTEIATEIGLKVPDIICVSKDRSTYIQTDLGTADLFQYLNSLQDDQSKKAEKLRQVIAALVHFQQQMDLKIDYNRCYPSPAFDRKAVLDDFDYFRTYFMDAFSIPYDQNSLRNAMVEVAEKIHSFPYPTFMYRDFQSRNIIYSEGNISFIDYQGGRKGPGIYDAISLVYQARLELTQEQRDELIEYYFEIKSAGNKILIEYERELFPYILWIRLLQVVGAYGRRGLLEKKPHFLQSMIPALNNLKEFAVSHSNFLNNFSEFSDLLYNIENNKAQIVWKMEH